MLSYYFCKNYCSMNKALFTSNSFEWSTPDDLFNSLDREFLFTLDVCASDLNHKCDKYYTILDDGLNKVWCGRVWCNPPYGRSIYDWIEKAYWSVGVCCELVVMLLPVRTDTKWFHNFIYNNPNCEIRFIRGRLHFNGSKNAAPFPSMIVVFK